MKNIMLKHFLKSRKPFSWLYLIYHAEKISTTKKKQFKTWLNSNDMIQFERVQPWNRVNGDETLRLNYDLNSSSVVFDVGGYKGEFARDLFCKYAPAIFVFEPLKEFYKIIAERFIKNTKIRVYNFGLSGETCKALIGIENDASSTLAFGSDSVEISLVSILEFIKENNIAEIDLIKINIEGGEYSLLEAVLESGNINIFKNIQVQFHDFVIPDAPERMRAIQQKLAKTHALTYQYEFVWENWKRI